MTRPLSTIRQRWAHSKALITLLISSMGGKIIIVVEKKWELQMEGACFAKARIFRLVDKSALPIAATGVSKWPAFQTSAFPSRHMV